MIKDFSLQKEHDVLILACKSAFGHIAPSRTRRLLSDHKINWDYIYTLSCLHGISNLLSYNITKTNNKSLVPSHYLQSLEASLHNTLYKNLIYLKKFKQLHKLFSSQGIPIIPLKGIAFLNSLYHNSALRDLSDIDILVKTKDIIRAEHVLGRAGYTQKKERRDHRQNHFHSVFWQKVKKFSVVVELHWDIDFPDSRFDIRVDDFWSRALVSQQDSNHLNLCPEDDILFSCFHIMRDNPLKKLALKNFCDIYGMIIQSKEQIDWDAFINHVLQYKATRPVLTSLLIVQELFEINLPVEAESILTSHGFKKEMTSFIIDNHVFPDTEQSAKKVSPSLLTALVSEKTTSKKMQLLMGKVKTICWRYCENYYNTLSNSIGYSIKITFQKQLKTFLNYVKVMLNMALHPSYASKMINRTRKKMERSKKLNEWLHEDKK